MDDEVQVNFIGMLIEGAIFSALDLVVMGVHVYLAILFKSLARGSNDRDYELIAKSFWLNFIALVVPFIYYLVKPVLLLSDNLNLYFAEIPYFLCIFLAVSFLIKFAKLKIHKSV